MSGKVEKFVLKHQPFCPVWMCPIIDNPIRRLFHNPVNILSPYIKSGFTVIDIGPGKGIFTIPLARMVVENGRVIAVDIQKEMLDGVMKRAEKAGLGNIISTHLSIPGNETPDVEADFILAFWMVHEVPDTEKFLSGFKSRLKQGGLMLIVEPGIHVTKESFARTLGIAEKIGFKVKERPVVSLSSAALLSNE